MDVHQLMTDISWAFRKQFGRTEGGLSARRVSLLMVGTVVVGVLSAVIIVGAGIWWLSASSRNTPRANSLSVTSRPTDVQSPSSNSTSGVDVPDDAGETVGLMVHVAGSVKKPGVYTVSSQARVADAVEAAGGFAKGASQASVNLAALVQDGSQIYIPSKTEVARGLDGASGTFGNSVSSSMSLSAGGSPAEPVVNINTATQAELESLPGIGPSTAQKIIEDRTANGPYGTVQDLTRVSGIGEKKVQSLEGSAVAK